MTYVIDGIILAIILAGAILGAVRGFIRSIAKPVRTASAFLIAWMLAANVGSTLIQPSFQETVKNQIADVLVDKCETVTIENVPTVVKIAAAITDTDIDKYIGETGTESAEKIADIVAEPTAHFLSTILAFVAIYVVVSLVLALVFFLLDKAFSEGAIGAVNRILGFVVSAAFTTIIAWAVTGIFTFAISTPALHETQAVQNFVPGAVYTFFRDFDPVSVLLSF